MSPIENFTYWKKPYHKKLVLAGAVLQIIALWFRVQDYLEISNEEIRINIFSQAAWEEYAFKQRFQFAISGLIILLFIGAYIIGMLAKNRKSARLIESIVLFVLALVWLLIGFIINVPLHNIELIIWLIILIATICTSVYCLYKFKLV